MKLFKRLDHEVTFGILLIILSAITYYVHFLIFRDPHHIFIYMVGDIAFVFIEVLMVTMILHRVLDYREKKERLEKLNMVIGIFFSEVGTDLLTYFSDLDPNVDSIRKDLIVSSDWTEREFDRITKKLNTYSYKVEPAMLDLERVRAFLVEKRTFLLALLENPNLMEHETFTDLLRSVFHLTEELKFRDSIAELPIEDLSHLAGDIDRAYDMLVKEWIAYMRHLKDSFPYFFSLAIRTNPFDQKASVVVSW